MKLRHFSRVRDLVIFAVFAARATAQELDIAPAVELGIPPAPGRVLRLENSTNLARWNEAEGFFHGRTNRSARFVSASDEPNFFRLESQQPDDLTAVLNTLRNRHGVPALAGALVRSNRIVAIGAVGSRKQGVDVPVTLDDVWHHGSITKSMTATLAGVLVQEGRISWTNTMASSFPDLAARMHPSWRDVTLSQLLRHRAGAPDQTWLANRGVWDLVWNHPGTPSAQRAAWLESVVTNAPQNTPGTTYVYSNTGYVFAGMMLEVVAGKPWEELITEKLFEPLGMRSAGFGVPARPRFIDQPWGHQWSNNRPSPVQPGRDADNPSGLGPAGTAHCTLLDLAKYAAFHAREGRGGGLLSEETFRALHTPVSGEEYALGWVVTSRPWAGGTALTHTGSNVQWFTVIWLAPNKDVAIVAMTNVGGSVAGTATDAVAGELIQRYLAN
jgi:CubicO group peptidase (beta-lactamase class C family)